MKKKIKDLTADEIDRICSKSKGNCVNCRLCLGQKDTSMCYYINSKQWELIEQELDSIQYSIEVLKAKELELKRRRDYFNQEIEIDE